MLCLSSGKFLGWNKIEEVYKFSNNLDSVVYAIAVTKKVPGNNLLPFNIVGTKYIGESGGQQSTWDQKDKKTGRGRLQTSFHNRMKSHFGNLFKKISENLALDEIIVIGIFIPRFVVNEDSSKQWQKSVESELIYLYGLMFGSAPQYNLAHQSKISKISKNKIKMDSISQKKVREITDTSLSKFYEPI